MATTTTTATATSELSLATGVIRQYDYWATVTKRTWRASIVSSFLSPIFYVVAMGVLLGGFIEGDPDQLEGATSYLAFIVPGLVAAHAMQTAVGETTYPVMGMFKWHKTYEGMAATPLQPRHLAGAHLMFVAFRLATTCGVFMLVLVPFGLFESWWGPLLAYLSQILVGMTFATLVYGLSCRMQRETGFGVLFRLGVFPLFLFSGAFFPVSNLGDVGAAIAQITPLWHGVNLSRMFAIDNVDWGVAAINVAYLVAITAWGWRWSVTGITKRLIK